MPKQVDHQQRRAQIAEAVCRLTAQHGLDAVSLRQVAAEAGVSMGRVQHYFTTKDEMLLFAFRTISEQVEQRMRAAALTPGETSGPHELLRAMLLEMLPLSEQAKVEAPVLAAFLARAVVAPDLADFLATDAGRLREFVAAQIGGVQPAATLEAAMLLALVDGLMLQLLTGQIDEPTALATLDHHLNRIFGTATRQHPTVSSPTNS
ncbi:TetR/AcrR family transcriptional regulator [Amycolatopsis taiwanensis]|uniref:HTH-type transcriptional regulator PksA n=1 Tax=Amycolatopsis taiwanensis TaxID=342230 RepID=A0A9W6R5K4_9PSEU|nr:TetR family transcriptional regulator C-terminal domain-containing protein [Amycolatopsis taiwanensis]GLY67885.1 HTH-type transcriptional regulator PksA [Amycolatopsis taiwanensis]